MTPLSFARACRISALVVLGTVVLWAAACALAVTTKVIGIETDFVAFTMPLVASLLPLALHRLLLRQQLSSPGVWSLLAGQFLLVLAGAVVVLVLSHWLFASGSGADPVKTAAWLALGCLLLAGEICGMAYWTVRPLPALLAKIIAAIGLLLVLLSALASAFVFIIFHFYW